MLLFAIKRYLQPKFGNNINVEGCRKQDKGTKRRFWSSGILFG